MAAFALLALLVIGTLGVVPQRDPAHAAVAPAPTRPGVAGPTNDSDERVEPMVFGIDAASAPDLKQAGFPVDYGVLWVGAWNLQHGWRDVDRQLERLREADVTPAIHLYYWGDDISPTCYENGCWSPIHKHQKDQDDWRLLAGQLVERLNRTMEGGRVLILVENEFNKAEVARYEPLDEGLGAMAAFLHAAYPAGKVVMPLGNWNRAAWETWDRFAMESDYVGIQAMRASTRHTATQYGDVFNDTLAAVRELRVQFHQPILIQDLALSSYPEPEFLSHQSDALSEFFVGIEALKRSGVEALYYRSLVDAREADRSNYFGQAERHWGLLETRQGPEKPAARVWYEGVRAEYVPESPDAPDGPDARDGPPAPDPFLSPTPTREPTVEERDTPAGAIVLAVAGIFAVLAVARKKG